MDTEKIVLETMEEVFGMDKDELEENMDMDLFEEGLADSLGIINLITTISENTGKHIEITKIGFDEMKSVRSLIQAVKRQLD